MFEVSEDVVKKERSWEEIFDCFDVTEDVLKNEEYEAEEKIENLCEENECGEMKV